MNQSHFDGETREYKKQISDLEPKGKPEDLHVHCNSFLHDINPDGHIHCEDDEHCPHNENSHYSKKTPVIEMTTVDPDCIDCFVDE